MKKIEQVLKKKGLSKNRAAMMAQISPSDLYQAINGKKPFFPAWRKRLSEVLQVPEDELFPEYAENDKGVD